MCNFCIQISAHVGFSRIRLRLTLSLTAQVFFNVKSLSKLFLFWKGGEISHNDSHPSTNEKGKSWLTSSPCKKKGKVVVKDDYMKVGWKERARQMYISPIVIYLSCIVIRSPPKPDVLHVPVTVQYYQVSQHWQLPFGESRKGKVVVFGPQRGLTCRTWSQTQRQSDQRGICSRVGPEIKQL